MSGGAGSVGGSGGYGQQPMGNASARPYDPTGGAPQQSTNQSNFGQGMNTMFGGGSPFGMQQQQPYGMQQMHNPFAGSNPYINSMPGYGMSDFQQQQQQMQNPNGPSQPTPMQMPQAQTPSWAGGYLGQQQPQQPSYMNNPDFQAYQKQEQDLGRQMNEYMQKAPMYQQLQDLQGKLRGFQQPQGQQGQMRMAMDMPPPGTFGDMRAAVMPQQPGSEQVASEIGIGDFMRRQLPGPRIDNRMGMPGYGGGRGGFGGGRGGYGQQPQQDYGYGQMQNQMRQQAQFGQQQRQQFGGLDALQQYLQPPSYRPPVVSPQPLNPGLTAPPPPPPPPPSSGSDGGPPLTGGF
jgi:hypothetical protein